jgi:RNA polymerase sigma-70 factor (ECF subfamily)
MMGTPAIRGLPPPFDEVIRRHEREILRYLLRLTRDREDALDLFQETWLRAYRSYNRLDSPDGVRPWLFRIATNLCLNRNRDRARHRGLIVDSELAEFHGDSSVPGAQDEIIQLKTAISRLPRKQREALVMRKFGGLEYDEIAAALECTNEAARASVYQAMKKIRDDGARV